MVSVGAFCSCGILGNTAQRLCVRCVVRFFGRLPRNSAGILPYGKGFLGNMTENLHADCVQSRQAGFVRCCLRLHGSTPQSPTVTAQHKARPTGALKGSLNKSLPFREGEPAKLVEGFSVESFSEYIRFYRRTDKTDISPFSACGYSRRCGHAGYSHGGTGGAVRRFCRRVRGSRRDSRYPVPHTAARQRTCR